MTPDPDDDKEYGARQFGKSLYGGAAVVSESASTTATATPQSQGSSQAEEAANTRRPTTLATVETTRGAESGVTVGSITPTVLEAINISGSASIQPAVTSTVIDRGSGHSTARSTTDHTLVTTDTTLTSETTAITGGGTQTTTETAFATGQGVETLGTVANLLELADAAQSEAAQLGITGTVGSSLIGTATASAGATQTTPPTYTIADHANVSARLTTLYPTRTVALEDIGTVTPALTQRGEVTTTAPDTTTATVARSFTTTTQYTSNETGQTVLDPLSTVTTDPLVTVTDAGRGFERPNIRETVTAQQAPGTSVRARSHGHSAVEYSPLYDTIDTALATGQATQRTGHTSSAILSGTTAEYADTTAELVSDTTTVGLATGSATSQTRTLLRGDDTARKVTQTSPLTATSALTVTDRGTTQGSASITVPSSFAGKTLAGIDLEPGTVQREITPVARDQGRVSPPPLSATTRTSVATTEIGRARSVVQNTTQLSADTIANARGADVATQTTLSTLAETERGIATGTADATHPPAFVATTNTRGTDSGRVTFDVTEASRDRGLARSSPTTTGQHTFRTTVRAPPVSEQPAQAVPLQTAIRDTAPITESLDPTWVGLRETVADRSLALEAPSNRRTHTTGAFGTASATETATPLFSTQQTLVPTADGSVDARVTAQYDTIQRAVAVGTARDLGASTHPPTFTATTTGVADDQLHPITTARRPSVADTASATDRPDIESTSTPASAESAAADDGGNVTRPPQSNTTETTAADETSSTAAGVAHTAGAQGNAADSGSLTPHLRSSQPDTAVATDNGLVGTPAGTQPFTATTGAIERPQTARGIETRGRGSARAREYGTVSRPDELRLVSYVPSLTRQVDVTNSMRNIVGLSQEDRRGLRLTVASDRIGQLESPGTQVGLDVAPRTIDIETTAERTVAIPYTPNRVEIIDES